MPNYPNSVPALPTTRVAGGPDPAADMNAVDAEVNAIGAELGTLPKGSFASVAARLAALMSAIQTQSGEGVVLPVFTVVPATAGVAPFQAQMQSFANTGGGAGTRNRGLWLGFNAARYSGGTVTAGKQGVYMGFEDNYYDAGGDNSYGVEWYVGYTTPDGTTIAPAGLRPFYFRVPASDVNSTSKNVIAWVDVGAGPSGNFSVMGDVNSQTQLFIVHKSLGIFARLPAQFTANAAAAGGAGTIQVKPTDGYAQIDIVAPDVGTGGTFSLLAFKHALTYRWALAGTTGSFQIQDSTNSQRIHMECTPGASDTAATTTFNSNLVVKGRLNAPATISTKTASYTLALTDANTIIEMNSASAQVFTIPPNSSVAFPIGTTIELVRIGAGSVTITPGSGVTIPNSIQVAGTSSRTVTSQMTSAALYKRGTNEWVLTGSIT